MIALLAGLVTFGFTAVLTIAGVGAAFILIPVFLALGVGLHTAMATALLLNAVAMSVASVNFVRKKLVVWNVTLPILVVATALSPVGAYVSQGLDRNVLLWLFIAFLVFAALMMLFYRPRPREAVGGIGVLIGIGWRSAPSLASSAACWAWAAATSSCPRWWRWASNPRRRPPQPRSW